MTLFRQFAARLGRSEDGVAAVEMSLLGSMFCVALLNVGELGRYAYVSMEASTATQAGAAAALATCDVAHVPATSNCAGLNSAVTTALRGTSLGSNVALSGQLTEGYYCLNNSLALAYMSGPTTPPADCSAVNNPTGVPALYLTVATAYTYTPMFPGLTVVDALPHQLSHTAWMRMK